MNYRSKKRKILLQAHENEKNYKEPKIVENEGFLFFPKTVNYETRWLCRAKWKTKITFCPYIVNNIYGSSGLVFEDLEWVE